MDYFVHPQGICESIKIGSGPRIWAFTHILPGSKIGQDCNICDFVFIENDVTVGDRVTIKSGVQLWDGVTLENDVFIGPNVTFTNDKYPRSKVYPQSFLRTTISSGASIGANATILPGITIHKNAMVGAGAVVTKNVPPNAKVMGNPARIVGYSNSTIRLKSLKSSSSSALRLVGKTEVAGVKVQELPLVSDIRGDLSVGEFGRSIPFEAKRYFLVFNIPGKDVRGEHAHRICEQYLICVKGSLNVMVDDGVNREEYHLNSPNIGLYLPPMVWSVQYQYSQDAVLLVFASHYYDPADYIRDYDDFLMEVTQSEDRRAG